MPPHVSASTLCALPFDHGKLPSAIAPPSCSNYAVMPSEQQQCCRTGWTANAPNPTAGPASASACVAAGAHMTTIALSMPTLVSHLASSYQEQDMAGACGPGPAMHAHNAHQTMPWHSVPTNSVVPSLAGPNDTALLEQMFGVATPPRFPLPPFRADAYVYTTPASTMMQDFGAYRLAPQPPQLPQQLHQLQRTNQASAAPMQIPMLDRCTQYSQQQQTRKRSADMMQGYPSTSYSRAADNVCLVQRYMPKRGRTTGSSTGMQSGCSDLLACTYPGCGSPSTFVAMGNRDHQHQLQQQHHQHQVSQWARPTSQDVCGSDRVSAMCTQSAPHHWQMVVGHRSQSQQQGQYLGLIPYGAALSSSLSEPLVLAQTRTPSPLEQRPQMLLQLPVFVKPVCSIHDTMSAAFSWLSFKQQSTMSLALHCLSRLDTDGALTHAVPQAWTQRAVVLLWMAAKLEENRFGLAGASRVAACISMLPGDATAMELDLLNLLDWSPYKGFKEEDMLVLL